MVRQPGCSFRRCLWRKAARSPFLEGVAGGYFEDNQEQPVVQGGPERARGVAEWSADPEAADRIWGLVLPVEERKWDRADSGTLRWCRSSTRMKGGAHDRD